MKKITLVTGCDWQGIYVDGKLQIESQVIELYEILEMLKENGIKVKEEEVDDDWFEGKGHRLPEKLKEVRFFE